jgi:dTMP kinase
MGGAARGFFLAFEGGEGSGKSTQIALLAGALRARDREVVTTREPGGTQLGALLRTMLLDASRPAPAPRTEALLYAADRAEHVARVVRPALARGAVVLTDRYVDSSVAYQGAGRELSAREIAELSFWATEGLLPDLTVLLDLPPAIGLGRAGHRSARDRLEAEEFAFHERVRSGFLRLAQDGGERYVVLPADGAVEQVHEAVLAAVLPRLAAGVPTGIPASGEAR